MLTMEETIRQLTAILLTYVVYSTVASVFLLLVVRPRWIGAPEVRLYCWRAGLVAPMLLAAISPWTAPPWSPVCALPISAPPIAASPLNDAARHRSQTKISRDAREVAASWRGASGGTVFAREQAVPSATARGSGMNLSPIDDGADAGGMSASSRHWPYQIAVVAVGG